MPKPQSRHGTGPDVVTTGADNGDGGAALGDRAPADVAAAPSVPATSPAPTRQATARRRSEVRALTGAGSRGFRWLRLVMPAPPAPKALPTSAGAGRSYLRADAVLAPATLLRERA